MGIFEYPLNSPWHLFDMTEEHQARERAARAGATSTSTIRPVEHHTDNPLRPWLLQDVIGQRTLKDLLRRVIDASKARQEALDHMLLIGAAGTGKTTVGYVVAHELGQQVFQLEAPVTSEQLLELRSLMSDRDVLVVDEVHRQVVSDRRGIGTTGGAEVLYHVMEDRTLITETGVLSFPRITLVACTTDEGLLPPSFLDRFPLQPRLQPYTEADMLAIAKANAHALVLDLDEEAARLFARAARGNPRLMNRYMKNAQSLCGGHVGVPTAVEVVTVLNTTTLDGLSLDMQRMLTYIYKTGHQIKGDGEVVYQASLDNVATALGKSRITKSVSLYTEPYLIEHGYVVVRSRGRMLTAKGIQRAQELLA